MLDIPPEQGFQKKPLNHFLDITSFSLLWHNIREVSTMKLTGKIYINANGQAFLPLRKAVMQQLGIKKNTACSMDITDKKIIIDVDGA